jgi:hypothetical protein
LHTRASVLRHPAATIRSRSPRAQFGTVLRPFGALRRRRNELEYPLDPADRASVAETADGTRAATALIDAASKILPNLGLF